MKFLIIILLVFSIMACQNGGGGTTIGNPVVSMNLTSEPLAVADIDYIKTPWSILMSLIKPSSAIADDKYADLKICFKRVRFKTPETLDSTTEDNIDFNSGLINFSGSEVGIGNINLPKGSYRRIEFDISKNCNENFSISIVNSTGAFQTEDTISIRFNGSFEHSSESILKLNMFSWKQAIQQIQASEDIKGTLESLDGSLVQVSK